jgi:hypothetical protein
MTSLIGILLEEVESRKPDVIVGSYFEPYGGAAALVGKLTGTPALIRHAGSDIGRLAHVPSLKSAYARIFHDISAVLTSSDDRVIAALDAIGIPREKHYVLKGNPLDFERFPRARPLDIDALLMSAELVSAIPVAEPLKKAVTALNQKPFRSNGPTIGIYGKAGDSKGTSQLAEALAVLAREGHDFSFLPMCSGWRYDLEKLYRIVIDNAPLAARSWILPPICSWRVPEFLARCDVIAFLENNFSVDFHTPRVPLEIIAARRLLLLSTDQYRRLAFRDSLIDGRNVLLVDLALGYRGIADRLREVLVDNAGLDRARSGATRLSKLLAPFSHIEGLDLRHPMLKAVEEFAA